MLVRWPSGTVVSLATVGGDGPHVIPVSAAVVAPPRMIVVGLAEVRGSLERLRARPQVAVLALAPGDVAYTAHGTATILDREPVADGVVAVRIDVESIQDHRRPTFTIDAALGWHWTDETARARDALVRHALERIAGEGT